MKLTLFLALMFLAIPAMAATTSTDHLETVICETPVAYDHSHEYTDETTDSFGAGVGADFVLLETGSPLVEEVVAEVRHDFSNDETRVYGVVRVNVFEALANR